MEKRKKITLIVGIGIIALVLVLSVTAALYHRPGSLQWTGTAQGLSDADDTAQVTLDLQTWEKLTQKGELTGTVTVGGVEYRSEDTFYELSKEYRGAATKLKDFVEGIQSKALLKGRKSAYFLRPELAEDYYEYLWLEDHLVVTADGRHIEIVQHRKDDSHWYAVDLP